MVKFPKNPGFLGRFTAFFELNYRNLGPNTHPSGEGDKAESAIDIDILALFLVYAGPVFIAPFYRAPFDPSRDLDAELHPVGMAAKRQMIVVVIINHLVFPM